MFEQKDAGIELLATLSEIEKIGPDRIQAIEVLVLGFSSSTQDDELHLAACGEPWKLGTGFF